MSVWVQEVTFGQGSYGCQCVLCGQSDYSGRLIHGEDCPAIRFPTREALFEALREVQPCV
jgi:hypothetical protein